MVRGDLVRRAEVHLGLGDHVARGHAVGDGSRAREEPPEPFLGQEHLGREGACPLFGAALLRALAFVDDEVEPALRRVEEHVTKLVKYVNPRERRVARALAIFAIQDDRSSEHVAQAERRHLGRGKVGHEHRNAEAALHELAHVTEGLGRSTDRAAHLAREPIALLRCVCSTRGLRLERAHSPRGRVVSDSGPELGAEAALHHGGVEAPEVRVPHVHRGLVPEEDARAPKLDELTTEERRGRDAKSDRDPIELRSHHPGLAPLEGDDCPFPDVRGLGEARHAQARPLPRRSHAPPDLLQKHACFVACRPCPANRRHGLSTGSWPSARKVARRTAEDFRPRRGPRPHLGIPRSHVSSGDLPHPDPTNIFADEGLEVRGEGLDASAYAGARDAAVFAEHGHGVRATYAEQGAFADDAACVRAVAARFSNVAPLS